MSETKKLKLTRQVELILDSFAGKHPKINTRADLLEEEAKKHLSPEVFSFVSGGSGKEKAMNNSRNAFAKWSIRPRVLRDVSSVDMSLDLYGQTYHSPLMLCPVGYQKGAHKDADLETARAAVNEQTPMIISMQSSYPVEKIAKVLRDTPKWMQLYWSTSDAYNKNMIKRAEDSGCSAIVLTLDTAVVGWRSKDFNSKGSLLTDLDFFSQYLTDPVLLALLDEMPTPNFPRHKNSLHLLRNKLKMAWEYPGDFLTNFFQGRAYDNFTKLFTVFGNRTFSWDEIADIRKMTKLPILLKGILHPDDAKLALKHKVDGIIVSSHGGRQLSSCMAPLDALPDVASAIKGKMPIIFDTGIQGGADMFKAIALGATAVGVGRPYYYALAIAGAVGVRELIRNLNGEFSATMALAGCTSLDEIKPDCLVKTN